MRRRAVVGDHATGQIPARQPPGGLRAGTNEQRERTLRRSGNPEQRGWTFPVCPRLEKKRPSGALHARSTDPSSRNNDRIGFFQIAGKRDKQRDQEAQEWIESVLGEKFPPGVEYEDVLRDGQVLCRLMNKIAPGSIPKINTSGAQFKMMENINMFQKALKEYGVPTVDTFQTVDLWEKKDIGMVTTTLFSLGRATYKHPEYQGPKLGPKPADENVRQFTEEQLKAGESIIGLQAGSNKGATQSGVSMGNTRHIIIGK